MGGVFGTVRGTKEKLYIGAQSDLTLPTRVSADSTRGIKPEFFLGMYSGAYGLDIGVAYEGNAFKLFYWSLYGTTLHYWDGVKAWDKNPAHPQDGKPSDQGSITDVTISGATVGEKITLKAYLNGSNITCEATRSNGAKKTLNCPLSAGAKAAFQGGAYVNRELNIAANGTSQVNPCNIYFYDAIFSNGFVTTTGGVRTPLNDTSSKITKTMVGDGNVDMSIVKVKLPDCGYDKNGYSYEKASIDLNKK